MEAEGENEQQRIPRGARPHEARMRMETSLLCGLPFCHLHLRLARVSLNDVHDGAVSQHGEEIPRGGEHVDEGVRLGREVGDGLVGVGEEMHEGRAQEDAAGELGPQDEEAFVPAEKVRGDAAGEGAHQEYHEAQHLRDNELPGAKVHAHRCLLVVAAASVAVDAERPGACEEKQDHVKSSQGGHGQRRRKGTRSSTSLCLSLSLPWEGVAYNLEIPGEGDNWRWFQTWVRC